MEVEKQKAMTKNEDAQKMLHRKVMDRAMTRDGNDPVERKRKKKEQVMYASLSSSFHAILSLSRLRCLL